MKSPPGDSAIGDTEAALIREGLEGQVACPFCGVVGDGSQTICPKCTMENTAIARKATKLRIGPWYVLQNRNPAAPGMKWETLLAFVRKGRVKPQSIVRGPTTHQLWRFAAHVKGLSREFGVCYSCGGSVEREANLCPHCNRLQEPPSNPDTLLEGAESEAKLPIFKEISPDQIQQTPLVEAAPAISADELEAQRARREQEEEIAREQREALERERQAAAMHREAAERELERARHEQEAIARDREAVERDKALIENDRGAIAREREALRREREAAATAAREAAAARETAIREAAALREAAHREVTATRESSMARESAMAREREATIAREVAAAREAALREIAAQRDAVTAREAASAREIAAAREAVAAREAAAAKEVAEARAAAAALAASRESSAARHFDPDRDSTALGDVIGPNVPFPGSEVALDAEPAASTPAPGPNDTSVWDMGEQDPVRQQTRPAAGSRSVPHLSNPAAPNPAAPPRPKARDAFLSPKDLAAAFKLNLAPTEQYDIAAKHSEAIPDPVPMSPGVFSLQDLPQPQAAGGMRKVVILTVVLLAVAGVAVGVIPELRQKVIDAFTKMSADSSKPPATNSGKPKDDDLPPVDKPSDLVIPPLIPSTTQPTVPTTPKASENTLPQAPGPVTPTTAPSTSGNVPPVDPKTTPAFPPEPSADIKARAKVLYDQAKEAEKRLDYAGAVKNLEELETLPKPAWPADPERIDFQLGMDRLQAKK